MRNKTNLTSRILSGLLAVMMIAGIFGTWPIAIFAEEPANENVADVWDGSIANGFGGGSGTLGDPYQIYTGAQLAYFASSVNNGTEYSGKHFKLMNDIDLNGIEWTPIGYLEQGYDRMFRGSFDGDHHQILGMTIHDPKHSSVGLFGYFDTDFKGTIKNLAIVDFKISGTFTGDSYYAIGGFAGWVAGDIQNVFTLGTIDVATPEIEVESNTRVGLFAGQIWGGTVQNCFAMGSASVDSHSGKATAGGFVGYVNGGTTKNSYAVGTVVAYGDTAYAAGFAGANGVWAASGTIQDCFSFTALESAHNYGNFVGTSNGSETNCHYYTNSAIGTLSDHSGSEQSLEVFMSQYWIAANLGWDFETVWTMTGTDDYPLPVLDGFATFDGMGAPEQCEHAYGVTERIDATCTENGYVRYTCSNCGDYYEEGISSPGHRYENGVCMVCGAGAQYGSVESFGYQSNQAALDAGEILYIDILQVGKDLFGENFLSWGMVDEYGNPLPQYLAYNDPRIFKTPGDWETGNDEMALDASMIWSYIGPGASFSEYCEPGGGYLWVVIGKDEFHNHSYVVVESTEPTCTTEGYIRYTCTECGETYGEFIPALAHTTDNGICDRCGEYIETPQTDLWDGTIANGFGGGSGTEYDPYLIYTGAELAYLAYSVNSGNSYSGNYFLLMNNIDLCGIEWTPIGVGSNYSRFETAFRGNFDGQFHTILGLNITQTTSNNIGLFGSLYNATVQNLQISEGYLAVEQQSSIAAGLLVGSIDGNSTVNHVFVSGEVSARQMSSGICCVGLVVGHVYYNGASVVKNIVAIGSVTGYSSGYNSYVGGVVGVKNTSGKTGALTVDSCLFIGSVNASDYSSHSYAGGILGISCGGESIQNCIFIGEIYSDDTRDAIVDDFMSVFYSNCYYYSDFESARGNQIEPENLQSQEWLASTLGWDFESVWTFDEINSYEFPLLQGFDGIGGNAHAHNYVEVERVEPTCGVNGYIRYTCTECERSYDEILPAFEHQYSESERVEPTCQVEGYIRYTCPLCGDYYDDVLPTIRHTLDENNYCTMCGEYIEQRSADILVVQNHEPWSAGSNQRIMKELLAEGKINSYKLISAYDFDKEDLNEYSVVYLVMNNDALSASQVNSMYSSILDFLDAGGTVIYGLCWQSNLGSVTLPADVAVNKVGSYYATIVDYDHPIISGELTDGTRFPDNAKGSSLNHTSVYNLPENANIILRDENGGVILTEYAYGNGSVILSCLTWECFYKTNLSGVIYSDIAYDDLILYAASLSGSGIGNGCQHNYTETVVEPTCGVEGYTRYTCTECGRSYDKTIPALEHQYSESERVEPTCQYDGYIRYTCALCGDYYDEKLYMLAHEYNESERVEPTCQYEGYIRYTCAMCGEYYDDVLSTIRHTLDENNYCTMCGEYIEAPVFDAWDGTADTSWYNPYDTVFSIWSAEQLAGLAVLVNGGNSLSGKTIYLEVNIDLSGYLWVPIGTRDLPFAGTFEGRSHIIDHMTIEGNYGNAGLFGRTSKAYISNVGLTNVNINISGRKDRFEVGALIGGQDGGITSGCFMQGTVSAHNTDGQLPIGGLLGVLVSGEVTDSYAISTVIATGLIVQAGGFIGTTGWYHKEVTSIKNCFSMSSVSASGTDTVIAGGFVSDNYATRCTVSNCFVRGCSLTSTRYIGAFYGRHNDGELILNNCYYSESNVSDSFGAVYTQIENLKSQSWIESTLGWDFENVWDFEAGSDIPGFSGSAGNNGDACKHSFTATVVDPTCTTDGYTHYACELCGYTYTGDYVSRLGHTVGEWIIDYEPSCTTSGRKHSECAVCGQQLENIYISSLGHSYVTEITREVTCTTPGILTHTCERCGSSYSTYVYSEHAYSITEQVQATCYTDGYTVYTCSKCGDFYTEVIPGGHDYKSTITKVATSEEDGEITYTCEACGDFYTEVIPAREAANVLLVQDKYPWGENNNAALLNQMLADGYITGWDMTTTSNFASVDLGAYNVILIANDQGSATYNQLNHLSDTLVQFATAGGVVIYGACDSGWAGGNINYTLPEGVVKKNFYSRYNYIVDGDHLIVSGILTDGKALTNSLLNGNYCSHSAFDANTLPADANIILQDAHGDATLVEYAVGDGHIILSGLTWEFYYNRNCYDGRTNTSYTKNVYDDLVMYALYLSDPCEHIYDEGVVVEPTCTEDGYIIHTCQNCGATMKDNVVEALGHTEGEWIVTTEPTQYAEGLKELRCAVCDEVLKSEVLPPLGGAAARVESDFDYVVIGDTIVFTLVIENCDPIKSLSVVPVFDTNVFEIISAEWLLQDAMIQNIEEGTYKSVSVWGDYVNVNCAVYSIVLKAKQFTDDTSVTFSLKVEDKEGVVTVVSKSVSVTECPHANTSVENINDAYHARVCDLCGYAVMEEHIYDDDYDLECDECGNTRECRHPETYVNILDGSYHVYTCALCGEAEYAEHMYDDEYDLVCDECGYERECYHPEFYITILDGIYHAHVCYVCGYEEAEEHTYDDGYDLLCDTCGCKRECPHPDTYVKELNDMFHVHICHVCGDERIEEHIYGDEFNVYCKECGYMNALKGDVDNDGDVDSDDAVYLVYNVFFGSEDYPVAQILDFDGDGQETTDDAIYLLYFIYFGEGSYPLH